MGQDVLIQGASLNLIFSDKKQVHIPVSLLEKLIDGYVNKENADAKFVWGEIAETTTN